MEQYSLSNYSKASISDLLNKQNPNQLCAPRDSIKSTVSFVKQISKEKFSQIDSQIQLYSDAFIFISFVITACPKDIKSAITKSQLQKDLNVGFGKCKYKLILLAYDIEENKDFYLELVELYKLYDFVELFSCKTSQIDKCLEDIYLYIVNYCSDFSIMAKQNQQQQQNNINNNNNEIRNQLLFSQNRFIQCSLDVSKSMKGEKWEILKPQIQNFFQNFNNKDIIQLATFSKNITYHQTGQLSKDIINVFNTNNQSNSNTNTFSNTNSRSQPSVGSNYGDIIDEFQENNLSPPASKQIQKINVYIEEEKELKQPSCDNHCHIF